MTKKFLKKYHKVTFLDDNVKKQLTQLLSWSLTKGFKSHEIVSRADNFRRKIKFLANVTLESMSEGATHL